MAKTLFSCLILVCLGIGLTQNISLELGFGGEVVANSWNPIRLEIRDHPAISLHIRIDQGSLKDGEIPVLYEAKLARSQGFSQFSDEIYLPEWRSLSWIIESEERILASGALGRRQATTQKLTLVLSNHLAPWLELLPDARISEALSHKLPEAIAAYDGVETIIIDGTVTAPSLEAMISAVSSGSTVILFGPLPRSYDTLEKLAQQTQRLGAGRLIRANRDNFTGIIDSISSLDSSKLLTSLYGNRVSSYPSLPRLEPVLVAGSLFTLAIVLAFKFLPNMAIFTSLVLSILTSFLAWTWLKPSPAISEQQQSLIISGGDLAQQQNVYAIVSLPSYQRTFPFSARLAKVISHRLEPAKTHIQLGRWSNLLIYQKPRLIASQFRFFTDSDGVFLRNSSALSLSNVYVIGEGFQKNLAGDSQIKIEKGALEPVSAQLERIIAHLPPGTAIAEAENLTFIALPEVSQ